MYISLTSVMHLEPLEIFFRSIRIIHLEPLQIPWKNTIRGTWKHTKNNALTVGCTYIYCLYLYFLLDILAFSQPKDYKVFLVGGLWLSIVMRDKSLFVGLRSI